jgi:hypothetical protein
MRERIERSELAKAAQHRVHRTSAGRARTFREAAPRGGFGVWRLFQPHPALAGNACRWAALRRMKKEKHTDCFFSAMCFPNDFLML